MGKQPRATHGRTQRLAPGDLGRQLDPRSRHIHANGRRDGRRGDWRGGLLGLSLRQEQRRPDTPRHARAEQCGDRPDSHRHGRWCYWRGRKRRPPDLGRRCPARSAFSSRANARRGAVSLVPVGADKLQGVITIQTFGPRDFTPEEINFVETVAGGLAFFIVNAELYQQTGDQLHQKVQELTTLQQVSKRIAEQLDLKEVLKMIVAKTVELARVDRADVFRVDEDDRLELAATRGGGQSNGVLSFIAQAVREGRPLAVLNAYSDSRFPDLAQVAANEGFHSLFCMPLKVQQNRIIGGICLYTSEARHFDYEQVRLLSTFADEAAIAIENARLYEVALRSATTKFASLDDPYTVTYVAISEALGVAQTAEHISAIGDFSVATLPANLSNLIPPDLERAIANLETVAQTVRTYLATTSLIKQHALLLQVNEELETIERVADRLSGRLGLLLRRVVFRWHQILDVVKLLIWTGWAWSPTHTL